jgi:glycosyltransferase involved in cell wall biosynthesis
MKIAIDVSQSVYGTGVSDYTINLYNNLPSEQVLPFGYSLRRRSELKRLFPSGKFYSVPPTIMDIVGNKLHGISIDALIGKIDVYHSSDWIQFPTLAKAVTTIHDLSPFIYPREMDSKIVSNHTQRMKWVVKECDKIICVSQNTAQDLQRIFNVSASRISIIYEALPQRFQLSPQIIKQTNYAVTIGARQPRKNIERLIGSYLNFKEKYSLPSKLIVIGEKPRQITDESVVYTGYITDQMLVNYLAGAQVMVYPSIYEGFGLPILGAFHHNVPVVTSNASSLPEVAGDAAVLVDPMDEESIAIGIASAVKNRDKLIVAGQLQLAKFSWEKTASQTLEVYNSIV